MTKKKAQRCNHCNGFGYVQEYRTRVTRVYCDCEAGDNRIKEIKKALKDVGLDPEDSVYQWRRRSREKYYS